MGRQSKEESKRAPETLVPGAHLEPIRVVRREITLPDGTVQVVDVPVYPPFRLEDRPPPKPPTRDRNKAKRRTRRAKAPAKK
jgi:hypothetical protein